MKNLVHNTQDKRLLHMFQIIKTASLKPLSSFRPIDAWGHFCRHPFPQINRHCEPQGWDGALRGEAIPFLRNENEIYSTCHKKTFTALFTHRLVSMTYFPRVVANLWDRLVKGFLKEKYLVDKQYIFSNTWSLFIVAFTFLTLSCETPKKENEIHLGSGAKVGEITSSSAIVHVRTTSLPRQDPEGLIPGTPGEVRIRYASNPELSDATVGDWRMVNNNVDHSIQIKLQGLTPGTRYYYQVDYRVDASSEQKTSATWSFPTAPGAQERQPVRFQVTTCQDLYADSTYYYMARQQPSFLVSAGDNVYYDEQCLARNVEEAYQAYQKMFGLPYMKKYFEHIGGYFQKDDHDYRFNDADPTQDQMAGDGGKPTKHSDSIAHEWLSHEEGIKVFKEVFPMGDLTYRSFRWGKGVQIILLEGRDYRSPNRMEDGPGKSIWGNEQKEWLQKTLLESDADWRIVVSPTPIIGPDRPSKNDNHANKNGFWTEGQWFLDWIQGNDLQNNVVLVCGDRHWQYHSLDSRNDREIHEFSCGPTHDSHTQKVVPPSVSPYFDGVAQPYSASKGGFLGVEYRPDRSIAFTHYDTKGVQLYSTVLKTTTP